MAKNGLIDEVVSQKALSQVQQLTDEVNKLTLSLEKALALSGGKNLFGDSKESVKVSQELEKLRILEEQRAIAIQKRIDLEAKAAVSTQKKVQLSAQERVELASQNNLLKLNAIATSEKVTALEQLAAKQKLASIQASEYAIKLGTENATTKEAALNARKLAGELQALQARSGTMGKGMNNAYLSTFQLTQVMRELPNFAIDARVGFMSLSNNLPMLADGFKQLALSVDETGKKLGNAGAAKVMLKSLLSFNTVMIAAVTLMTLYGDKIIDWVGKIFKGNKAVETFISTAKQMHQTVQEGIKDSQKDISVMELLYKASQDRNRSLDERKAAVDALQTQYPSYFGNLSQEEILTGKATQNYKNLANALVQMAVAKKLADKYAENRVRQLELEDQNNEFERQIVAKRTDLAKRQQAVSDYAKKAAPGGFDAGESAELARLDKKRKESQDLLNNYTESVKKNNAEIGRISNANNWIESNIKVKDLINANTKGTENQTDAINVQTYANEKQAKSYNKLGLLLKPIIDKTKDLASNELLSYADRRNAANDWADFMQISEEESLKIKKDALYKEYQEALKTTKDKAGLDLWYKTEKEKIEIESTNNSIEIENEFSKIINGIRKDELANFKENKDRQDKIDEEAKDAAIKRAEAIKDKLDQLKEDVRRGVYDMVYQTLDAVSVLFDKINEKESESLSKKQDEDEKAFDKKEELINNSLISESDKQEQLDALDAERVKNQEEYAQKESEIKKKQATENAIIGAANIWLKYFETIAAYTLAEAELAAASGGLLAPVAISTFEALKSQALVQTLIGTAAVAIPAFEKGGEMKHDGLAMVSEKRQEWGINPDGSVFLTPDRPSIVHLQKGARIFPDASQMTNEAIMRVSADAAVYNFSTKDMEAAFSREINGLKAEIRKLQPVQKKDRLMDEIRYSNVLRRFKN